VGFEPTVPKGHNGFRDRPIRPLSHPSKRSDLLFYSHVTFGAASDPYFFPIWLLEFANRVGTWRLPSNGTGHDERADARRWELRVYTGRDEQGRPHQVSRTFVGGKRAATKALTALIADIDTKGAPTKANQTLGELLDDWLAWVSPQREPGTVRGYATCVKRIKKSAVGGMRLSKVTARDLDQAYRAWLDDGLSPTTVHHTHTALATALHQAVKWGTISNAVTDRASPPSIETFHVKATDPALIRLLITEAEEKYPILAAAIALGAATGCRRGELCGLQWSDIEGSVLHVRRSIKHAVDRTKLIVGPTKTHQERKLALDSFALSVIAAHRANVGTSAAQALVQIRPDSFCPTTHRGPDRSGLTRSPSSSDL
jgi:integrase